jgi:cell wall-associated NlpC family hydrolase
MRRRLVVMVALCALTGAVVVPGSAGADAIGDKRQEAARLADRLESLRLRGEQLAEAYNDAQVRLAELQVQVAATREELATTEASFEAVRTRMADWAVTSYVEGSSIDPVLSVLSPVDSLESVAGVEGYSAVALGRDDSLRDELRQRGDDTERLGDQLDRQVKAAEDLAAEVDAAREAAAEAAEDTERELDEVKGELATLVAEEQARRAAAAEEAARREIEAQAAARRAAVATTAPGGGGSSGGGSSSSGSSASSAPARVPPAPSPGAAGAVDAAMSMLGVRYRWAGSTPEEGFDCSGLTSWAWARAGRYLPHSSRAQYASLPHVDFEDIQPGDLVFFGSPIHHVGMYIGGGQMVNAPQTGDVVKVSSVYRRDMVGVGRP